MHHLTIPNPAPCSPPPPTPVNTLGEGGGRGRSLGRRPAQAASFSFTASGASVLRVKEIDVATLGNLCVEIVLDVEELPPPFLEGRKAYMEKLSASPPDKRYWEAGGNCNTATAAARRGLHCSALGHVGGEIYGQFLLDVLHDEGIGIVGMNDDVAVDNTSDLYETLLCWVCCRADSGKEPAFRLLGNSCCLTGHPTPG